MKKKVLFILHLPQPIHGASIVGEYIYRSEVVNNMFETDYINLSTSSTIKKIGSLEVSKFVALFKVQFQLLTSLFSKKYNLCYMTLTAKGSGFYKDVLVVLLLKLFRKKIVYHFHNKGIAINQNKLINHLLYKFVFKNSSVILLSPILHNDVERYFNMKEVLICPNGIKSNDFLKLPFNKKNKLQILFFSNMLVMKGPLVLLEACKLLKKSGVDFECHFVGEWSDVSEEYFRNEIVKLELQLFVFAHGKKMGLEKDYFFENADVFVLPTFQDCFPLVLLEAMSYGLPMISTNEGAIPEILEDGINGFIVPKNDVLILFQRINELSLDNGLMIQMSKTNVEKYKSKYTLKKFEENFSNILKEIA